MTDDDAGPLRQDVPAFEQGDDVAAPDALADTSDTGTSKQLGGQAGGRGSLRRSQWTDAPERASESPDEPSEPGVAPDEAAGGRVRRPRVVLGVTLGVVAGVLVMGLLASEGKGKSSPATAPVSDRRSAAAPKAQIVPTLSTISSLIKVASAKPNVAVTRGRATAAVPASPARPATSAQPPSAMQPGSQGVPVLPPAAAYWLLNQTVGNTAVDSVGAHNATAQDAWWAGGQGCLFSGTESQIYTDGSVLDTGPGSSFTVSAWVYLSGQTEETAVSQDGTEQSAFSLQYTESANRWAFTRVAADTASPAAFQALSESAPALNTWTHLVGVYDAANDTQYLYVNGVAQGTATDTTPFSTSGDLVIGRDLSDGQDADWFKGAIKKVELFDAALSQAQVAELS